MSSESVLKKYWTPVIYIIVVCITFVIVYVVMRGKKKHKKIVKPAEAKSFNMKLECELLMTQQQQFLKNPVK